MSTPVVHEYGPYTLYDLDALPEDGKRYELADGWLAELSPSPWQDNAADRLKEILKSAAWIVELDPAPKVIVLVLSGDAYVASAEARAGGVLSVDEPFPVRFGPALINELD